MPALFYYDLMSPYAYLAAERVDRVLPEPLRWPDPWPSTSLQAMRTAVYARRVAKEREFASAAFEAAFVEGRDLADLTHVMAAAEQAGLDPAEVQEAIAGPSVKDELRDETDRAHARGVFGVPTVAVGDELFWGDDRLEEAAVALARSTPSR